MDKLLIQNARVYQEGHFITADVLCVDALIAKIGQNLEAEDAQVIAGGITVLRIVAVSEPMFAALIIFEGVFNGIGDTRAPFVFSIISMWGVRIAGTCFCVLFLHAGLELVWVCMVGDNVTRCLLLGHRFVKGSRSKGCSWRKRFGAEQ